MTIPVEWILILFVTWLWSYIAWVEFLFNGSPKSSTWIMLLVFWLCHFATLWYMGM